MPTPEHLLRPDVELEPLKDLHADAMLKWVQDPYIFSNICMLATPSLERTLAWIARASTDSSIFARGVFWNKEYVGNVILDRIESLNKTARFSIYIGASTARGTGVGRTAGYLALKHGFDVLELRKVYLYVHVKNLRAIKSYQALGFVEEGILRQELFYLDAWTDAKVMSLLRSEFETLRKEFES